MVLLLPGGHLGGVGGNARQVGGSGEGVLTQPTVPDGFRWGVETGELAHLLLNRSLNPHHALRGASAQAPLPEPD